MTISNPLIPAKARTQAGLREDHGAYLGRRAVALTPSLFNLFLPGSRLSPG
jgi:hypothetical protein